MQKLLFLDPVFQEKIWGGDKLKKQFHYLIPSQQTGECWAISAHKNGEQIPEVIKDYNHSIEPGAVIAVAGRSNGLGGALSANLTIPVFNCPPFSDKDDMMVNINSSLMMPSNTPAATVVDPKNAAQVAMRSLNLQRLKTIFQSEIDNTKSGLIEADKKVRGRCC